MILSHRMGTAQMERPNNGRQSLRSRPSAQNTRSFIRFCNKTNRQVDIVWLNYQGENVRYSTLGPHQFVNVNTFAGHPWISCDSQTGERLVVELKDIYEPVAYDPQEGWPPQRRVVNITIPVFSLQSCCLQLVRRLIQKNQVQHLEITDIMKEELYKMYGSVASSQRNKDENT
ncbi:hypothetical protein ACJMK2_039113 [Sinanodonta woodiana]|uniref:von Hippel-Lindau disease tumor suppressor n=2 Tax=Sinanodonta woodiana TaxID=1069815 RepID=A0ABD3WB15_SINWO